jgi:hypothetical protein
MTEIVEATKTETALTWETVLQRNGFFRTNFHAMRWSRTNREWHLTVQPTNFVDENDYMEIRCSYPRPPQGEFYQAECGDPSKFVSVLQQLWTRIVLDHGGEPAMPGGIADSLTV